MSGKAWEIATLILALVAVGLGSYAYMERSEVNALTAQLAAQTTAQQQQLQSAETRLAAESRPDLPVTLGFRQAMLSAGLVGVFRNTSGQELEFTLDLESPATGQRVRKAVVLNANGILEIGAQQGWAFAPGQRVMLNNPAYRPRAYTVGG